MCEVCFNATDLNVEETYSHLFYKFTIGKILFNRAYLVVSSSPVDGHQLAIGTVRKIGVKYIEVVRRTEYTSDLHIHEQLASREISGFYNHLYAFRGTRKYKLFFSVLQPEIQRLNNGTTQKQQL